jgi:hypothetical protein
MWKGLTTQADTTGHEAEGLRIRVAHISEEGWDGLQRVHDRAVVTVDTTARVNTKLGITGEDILLTTEKDHASPHQPPKRRVAPP